MVTIYNSRDTAYKTPFGAVRRGEEVTFILRVPKEYGCNTPYLFIGLEGGDTQQFLLEPQGSEAEADVFSFTFTPRKKGLHYYYFDLYSNFQKLYCGPGGEAYVTTEGSGPRWQLTVYGKTFETPKQLRGGVMYQIFPDRFYEGKGDKTMPYPDRIYRTDKEGEPYFWPNEQHEGWLNKDYYGGDLVGIQEKLPYLAFLGVTILYLNPIFEAHSNHRYNTADYKKIDPVLGTEDDFKALCEAAASRGISIVLDGVFSHTGSDSVYFNREGRYQEAGAFANPESPYRKWYDFSKDYPCGYRSWWGFETLPEVNETDAGYRSFVCGEGGVIDHWLSLGASGFRLDVADELPDDFIEEIRVAVKRHGEDKFLLGEVWEDATSKWSYGSRRAYLLGGGLDSVMNYPFQTAVLEFLKGEQASITAQRLMAICENYPPPALHTLMNFVSTHDTVRGITALVGEPMDGKDRHWQSGKRLSWEQYETGRRLLTLAYAMQFTLPGIPSIYYGDEVCMQGYKDPFNRGYFEWESQERRVVPVLRTLAALRKSCPAFEDGALRILHAEGGLLVYQRRGEGTMAEICVNRTEHTVQVILAGKRVTVPPQEFAVETCKL